MDYEKQMMEDYLRTQSPKVSTAVLCPHTFDTKTNINECVLCDLAKNVIFNRSLPKNDPLKERAKSLSAKRKYYSNMIFLSNPSEVMVLEYGEKIFNKLIAAQVDPLSEWKNFMHPTQGRNLYITKIKSGPEAKDVDYNVEPRLSISSLPDPSVMDRLYNIQEIAALIESGRVKPIPQSKFDFQKTEIRILPSGNPECPMLFYKALLWHFNISKEDYERTQRGTYNPITGESLVPSNMTSISTIPSTQFQSPGSISPSTSTMRPTISSVAKGMSDNTQSWSDVGQSSMDIEESMDEADSSMDEPLCFGSYDPNNKFCVGESACVRSGWAESCKKIHDEKLELRNRLKKLAK